MSSNGNKDGPAEAAAAQLITLADTWQLRFDIPVDSSSEIAKEFARSWTELLEAQKLTSVVSSGTHPREIKVQVCAPSDEDDLWSAGTECITGTLKKLAKGHKPEVQTERIHIGPNEWQGFRLWMTLDRQEAEKLFIRKKPKRRFFGSRVFKKLYSMKD